MTYRLVFVVHNLCMIFIYVGYTPLKDHDYLRLQFLGANGAWLGCWDTVCDLRSCPSHNNNYQNFHVCTGEIFQIIGKGSQYGYIKSGQQIRLRYVYAGNIWMGCPLNNRCDHRDCPGSTVQARDFNRCGGETFVIYARGKKNGAVIYSGDVVMLAIGGKFVSIRGRNDEDDTSLDDCPVGEPPAYLSYGICSNDAFRVYRKP